MSRSRWSRCAFLGLALIVLCLAGCLLVPGDPKDAPTVANLPPTVRITGGGASSEPAAVDYKVRFDWTGSDADGLVRGYRWALDDTVSVGAWHDTTGASVHFIVSAATPVIGTDSVFADWHTFYVQAVDNQSAWSAPDRRYFSARNIAPTSRITHPVAVDNELWSLSRNVRVTWDGEDTDSSRPDGKPVAYEYKLVRLSVFPAPGHAYVDSLRNGRNLLDSLSAGLPSRWLRVPATTPEVWLRNLPIGGCFVFGVRAVDEAGAVEPSLERNRNYLAFAVQGTDYHPSLTITEPSLGTFVIPLDGVRWELSVPSGRPLRFSWTQSAVPYGGRPGLVNYALDVPDPADELIQDPQGIGGWIGWGDWRGAVSPFVFGPEEAGTVHYLWILVRNPEGFPAMTRAYVVRMQVVGFGFSKFGLVVDDARFAAGVSDAAHDTWLNETILSRFRDLGGTQDVSIWTAPREIGTSPSVLRLEDIADYQNLVWSGHPAVNVHSGLGVDRIDAVLTSYLNAGGRLFIFGGHLAAMNRASLNYPFPPPGSEAERGKLYFRFLYMRDQVVSSRDRNGATCYERKSGLHVARSANPAYPDITLDPQKWNPEEITGEEFRGGIADWEGVMQVDGQAPMHEGGLDTLYTAQTWNRSLNPGCGYAPSPVDGAIIGARFHSTPADTLAGRQHGRVLYLNFQPWWFEGDNLLDAGTAAVNWLVTGRDW